MSSRSTKFRNALLGASAIVSVAALASPAAAAAQPVAFDMPAQPLTQALKTYGATADQQLIFSERLVAGRQAPALRGEYSPEQALGILLAGSGLTAERTPGGIVTIRSDSAPQSGSAAGDGAEVEALIVTAQKREEDIQDVPIAISAFSQEDLERTQIAGGPDLMTQVPNMTFTKTNFTGYSIQIRGIGTQAISATTDAAVAVALNNTPFIRNRFFEQEFYDLQRVEVLRGPQGTLYGRNATAGVVNLISAKPKFITEAKASGDLSNYNTTRIEGMVNIPLVEDVVALRLAGAWTKRDGFVTNEITGNPIDGRDLWSTRLSLRFAPTDTIDANLIWEHFEEDDDRIRSGKQLCKKHVITEFEGIPVTLNTPLDGWGLNYDFQVAQGTLSQGCERESLYSPESFQTPNGSMLPYYLPLEVLGLPVGLLDPYRSQVQSRDLRVIESTWDPQYRANSDVVELQVSWDVTNSLTLTSETAYSIDSVYSLQDFNRFNTAPQAWRVNPGETVVTNGILSLDGFFCDPQLGCSDRLVAVDLSTGESRQFSQEFRLGSDFDGPFNFSLGANFLRFDGMDKYYVFFNSVTMTAVDASHSTSTMYEPNVSDNSSCLVPVGGFLPADPAGRVGYSCPYIDPNPIDQVNDQGHNYFLSKNPYKLISYAVFGESYYNVTDNLKITAGLRWTVDKKQAPRIPSWVLGGISSGYPVLEVIDQEWREPTGRLTIDWKPDLAFTDETLLYASYAHGYKAGGANPPPMVLPNWGDQLYDGLDNLSVTRPKTFDAEFIDAFEIGTKNTLADGRVTLNLSAFYYDYEGYQISEIIDRSAFNRNFDAEVWGAEIEADWRPLENLKLSFKGGYENTRIKDGEQAIDLMDRTAGNDEWTIVRPFPTYASSCILPKWLFVPRPGVLRGISNIGNGSLTGCEMAYFGGLDPITNLPYVPDPTVNGQYGGLGFGSWEIGEYPGWNPLDESVDQHNGGEGFFKQLGGNELPNAPNFTATLSADYTVPLAGDWLVNLHTDLYWQSESWWRVFNDHEYNRLDEYFTMNLAAIFTNEDAGWRVMAYVKNVFDRDSITGAFLNSDDTGLTTNVFLTEPRLYGLRVTKEWTGGPLFGSFGARHDGPYPFTVELGGQVQRHDAPNAALAPSFIDQFSDETNPLRDQESDLDWGDGRDVKLTWQPAEAWKVSLGARYGKTNKSTPWEPRSEIADRVCDTFLEVCEAGSAGLYIPLLGGTYYGEYNYYKNYSITSTYDSEKHSIIDFAVGVDVGIGALSQSTVSAGLRHAKFESTTSANVFGVTNWDVSSEAIKYLDPFSIDVGANSRDWFEGTLDADREFKGAGPVLSWEASKSFLGDNDTGVLGLDWSLMGGVLFGKRKTMIEGEGSHRHYYGLNYGGARERTPEYIVDLPPVSLARSEDVTVPTFGASLGVSYRVDRFSIGAGYRWERYQDAIDGGFTETQEEDRTIDGPYFKLSVGFGGG